MPKQGEGVTPGQNGATENGTPTKPTGSEGTVPQGQGDGKGTEEGKDPTEGLDPKQLYGQRNYYKDQFETTKAKLKQYEEQEAKAKQKKLEEEGNFKEIIGQKDQDLEKSKQRIRDLTLENEFTKRVVGKNPHDVNVALAALDRTKIQFGDDGTITGLDEAVQDLITGKPFLFNTGAQGAAPANTGAAHNPKADAGGEGGKDQTIYTKSDLVRWQKEGTYKEHREAFLKARSEGRVDMTK